MKKCLQCGNSYPDEFQFCPVHGNTLVIISKKPEPKESEKEISEAIDSVQLNDLSNPVQLVQPTQPVQPAQPDKSDKPPTVITVRTLVIGLAILVLLAMFGFAAAFLYQYQKPKYGELIIKTTPEEALIYVDGKARGSSPLNISKLQSGGHEIKIVKEGYRDVTQQVTVIPYTENTQHWKLEPIVPQLSTEQLAEIEELHKKLDSAQKENILLPPPEDYNVLYFVNKILVIDPVDAKAVEARTQLANSTRQLAELAYARENWRESEKQYRQLVQITPDDTSLDERLADLAERISAGEQDRAKQIQDLQARAEAAMKVGSLTPPDKDNALDAIRNIQRLDKNNAWARDALKRLLELLQNRGDAKMAASDWAGARTDFQHLLQHFPEDSYGKTRLAAVETRLEEASKQERSVQTEQQLRQKIAALHQSALDLFASGSYAKSIAEWHEYLKLEPKSDEAWFYIGASYQNQKQLDTAIANFEKCLELNSSNVLAHLNVGLLYDYHRKDYKTAEAHLRRDRKSVV